MSPHAVYLQGMTIISVRLSNARQLAEQCGGQQRFADRMNMSRQQASHIIGRRPHKNIGHELARRIEQVFEMPVGWLDLDHKTPALVNEDTIEVPLLTVSASAGVPGMPAIEDEVVRLMRISKRWIRLNVQASAFEYLALITANGDSMEPTFTDGSILLVDRGVTSVKVDGVYILATKEDVYCKRVQRNIDGSLTMRSDNAAYKSFEVSPLERHDLQVLGRVLVAWNPKKL